MNKKMVASGSVELKAKTFYYEFWSDNSDVTVKIYHRGRTGSCTEFVRRRSGGLKSEMENALVDAKVI